MPFESKKSLKRAAWFDLISDHKKQREGGRETWDWNAVKSKLLSAPDLESVPHAPLPSSLGGVRGGDCVCVSGGDSSV